jgi:hypothetical protein
MKESDMAEIEMVDPIKGPMPPGCVWTTRGWLHEGLLTKTVGALDDENETTAWQEWRDASGEIVKREAQVQLKKWPEGMDPEIAAQLGRIGG